MFKNKQFATEAKMRIAIVGSRRWTDKHKVLDFIGLCKNEFGDKLEIVSGGCPDGADRYAKECSLSLGVKYIEFPPLHKPWNPYCVEPKYLYGKSYSVKYFFMRNTQIAEYSSVVVLFIPEGCISNGSLHTKREAEKLGKRTVIIN